MTQKVKCKDPFPRIPTSPIRLGQGFRVYLDIVDPVQDQTEVILETSGFHLVKDQNRENLSHSIWQPIRKCHSVFSVTQLVFTEYLGCGKHLLKLADESGKLGKSPLLQGSLWVFYPKC